MINVKRDTIIKKGDILISSNGQEHWDVINMQGSEVEIVHISSKQKRSINKNDLIVNDWKLEVKNRGYW